jgi:4-diphosphocytidyl-2-C-methyl-D-erythritol kinase
VITFPNCKINIGLNILNKREDGFHNLETVFYPLPLTDALEIIETRQQLNPESILFTTSGLEIAADTNSNICVKAFQLLKSQFPMLPDVLMHLHKVIPSGAGLGGGSADGAFALSMINKKFNLGLKVEKLIQLAASLGSDCPFFIINKPCFASGRGELLEEIPINLSNFKILLVNPGIHIDTATAFKDVKPKVPGKSIKEIIKEPIANWKEQLTNDFEKGIFARHQVIEKIKNALYDNGAIYASMSGSGSTLYGIFEKDKKITAAFPPHYFIKELLC